MIALLAVTCLSLLYVALSTATPARIPVPVRASQSNRYLN